MARFRLLSTGLIHTPGLLASMMNQYKTGGPEEKLHALKVLAGYGTLPTGAALAYLEGETVNSIEDSGSTVVFEWGEEMDPLPTSPDGTDWGIYGDSPKEQWEGVRFEAEREEGQRFPVRYEIRDRWDANQKPLETHTTEGEAMKALRQWMNDDDKLSVDAKGNIFILAPDYEPTDIFALKVE